MSHMLAIVLVEPDCADPEARVAEILAPHEEWYKDDETYGGWWDWYVIGGRWDGVVQGENRAEACEDFCHFRKCSHEHRGIEGNLTPVRDLREVQPYRLVLPDGSTMARQDFSRDDQDGLPWEERDYTVKEYPEFYARGVVAYRDHLAVGVDYHS